MKTPCNTGFNCPYWGHDEDGMGLCTAPEVTEKEGRHYVYPLIMNLDICPLMIDYSPMDKWLKSLDKGENGQSKDY